MNDLITRFSAVVQTGPGRTGVTLMPDPIDRYADPEAGQVDGAIFAFAVDHNPEVLVLLEVQRVTLDKTSWRYAVAPATAAPFDVAIDGKQVWTAPYHSENANTPTGPYFVIGMPRVKP